MAPDTHPTDAMTLRRAVINTPRTQAPDGTEVPAIPQEFLLDDDGKQQLSFNELDGDPYACQVEVIADSNVIAAMIAAHSTAIISVEDFDA